MSTTRYVNLSIATVNTPATTSGTSALNHLIGIALFVAERDGLGRWSFSLDAATADDGEDRLLDWIADHLPHPATVIGWQLAEHVVPTLLVAAEDAEADVAQRFASACARTFTSPAIDLADAYGGVAAPPFAETATEAGIPLNAMTASERFTAWAFSMLEPVRTALEEEAVALWGVWLRRAGRHPDAPAITARWLRTKA